MNSSTDTSQMLVKPKRTLSLFSFFISLIAITLIILAAIFMFPRLAEQKKNQDNANVQLISLSQSLQQSQETIDSLTDQLNKQQVTLKKLMRDNHSSQQSGYPQKLSFSLFFPY